MMIDYFLKQFCTVANVTQIGVNSTYVGDYFELWINKLLAH